jgi:THO complex subunit 5
MLCHRSWLTETLTCAFSSHKYTALPLIPLDGFYSLFPEHKSLGEHDLMITRIAHEHAERQALEEKRQGLLKRKQALIAENNRRKEDLANLDKDLERFIEAADPIIKTFEKEY